MTASASPDQGRAAFERQAWGNAYQQLTATAREVAHLRDYRVYEALDLGGHRWRFLQWLREVPQSERR